MIRAVILSATIAALVVVGTFQTLIMTMAHEMIHVHQDLTGMPRDDGKGFAKLADRVCKELEFDRLIF